MVQPEETMRNTFLMNLTFILLMSLAMNAQQETFFDKVDQFLKTCVKDGRVDYKALKKNLNRRYESVSRMRSDLEKFAGWRNIARCSDTLKQIISSIELKKQTTTVVRKAKKDKKKKRHRISLFSLYFLLIAVIATFFFVLFRILFHQ